jgi:hypothetical protein
MSAYRMDSLWIRWARIRICTTTKERVSKSNDQLSNGVLSVQESLKSEVMIHILFLCFLQPSSPAPNRGLMQSAATPLTSASKGCEVGKKKQGLAH